jgi:hypothetical protein
MIGAKRGWRRWLVLALLWGVAILFLIPFVWMLSSSLKPNYQMFEIPPRWIPNPPRWENYTEALTILPFDRYLRNTAVITLLTIIGHLTSCTLIAYAFARLRAPGRDLLFVVMLATMMLPYPVTMTPLYALFNRLGWINTILPLTAPAFLGSAFYIFLMRQFLPHHSPRLRGRRTHRRRQHAPDHRPHHGADGVARTGDGHDLHLPGDVERLPRPADLLAKTGTLHGDARPSVFPLHVHHQLGLPHGGVAGDDPARDRRLLRRAALFHRRHHPHRRQRLVLSP